MKKYIINSLVVASVFLAASCKQEIPELTPPVTEQEETPSAGSADFSKFITVGTSYTAGFQAGALFTAGQDNSLGAILNKQLTTVGASSTFTQPTINSEFGYNIFVSPNPMGPVFLGRFLLQYGGEASPTPTPQVSSAAAAPSTANPAFMYAGTTSDLNNFSVQAITLAQFLTPATGGPAVGGNPAYSPFYARFASAPSVNGTTGSTIISDAISANSTFFMFWAGMDDFMLYAAYGGDFKAAPLTSTAVFPTYYGGAVNALLTTPANELRKGVLGNFPDIFVMPHFTSVSYNPIPLDEATAAAVSSGFAGYNAALDGIVANAATFGLTAGQIAQINSRKVSFSAVSNNAILIRDTDMFDLGPYFDGLQGAGAINATQRAQLAPYQRVRQTTSDDIIPLGAGAILGTTVDGNPLLVNGVSVPLDDRYVIVPSERDSINDARTAFNAAVASTQAAHADQLALADVAAAMQGLVMAHAGVYNNVTITPNINPPTGIFSEDGLHPNTRGYAFISRAFIAAINEKFGAKIPLTNIANYPATALPIP